jgi:hypothetical protein
MSIFSMYNWPLGKISTADMLTTLPFKRKDSYLAFLSECELFGKVALIPQENAEPLLVHLKPIMKEVLTVKEEPFFGEYDTNYVNDPSALPSITSVKDSVMFQSNIEFAVSVLSGLVTMAREGHLFDDLQYINFCESFDNLSHILAVKGEYERQHQLIKSRCENLLGELVKLPTSSFINTSESN